MNGDNESQIYTILKKQQPNEEPAGLKNKVAMKAVKKMSKTCKKKGDIVWNFTKFLVDKDGNAVRRYDPTFDPANIEKDLVEILTEA